MPAKNAVKIFDVPAYYHVYNRAAGGGDIFLDDQDRQKFLSLLRRHLDLNDTSHKSNEQEYDKYSVELVAYCLMSSHFHLLLYQEDDPRAITCLMRSVATAYTMYFNRKYKTSGHLFQGVFKASRIEDEAYLLHITRYIHMNPRSYLRYPWSSISYYLGAPAPEWISPSRVAAMAPGEYRRFLADYQSRKVERELLKSQLAG